MLDRYVDVDTSAKRSKAAVAPVWTVGDPKLLALAHSRCHFVSTPVGLRHPKVHRALVQRGRVERAARLLADGPVVRVPKALQRSATSVH